MISVCLASYNGERFIKPQIDSILGQLGPHDELIVSDDKSSDGTVSILSSISDSRLIVLSHKGPRGIANNFQNALLRARGDIVFLADQDDLWLPGKVSTMAAALDKCVCVVCDCTIVDENEEEISVSYFARRESGPGFFRNLVKNSYMGCCMAFRKKALQLCLPFPHAIPMHDWWIGLLCELLGPTRFIQKQLVLYRMHANNMSPTAREESLSQIRQILMRIQMFLFVLWRYITRRPFL